MILLENIGSYNGNNLDPIWHSIFFNIITTNRHKYQQLIEKSILIKIHIRLKTSLENTIT